MRYYLYKIFFLVVFINSCLSQISPPGLGSANMANWNAVGIRQELDTIEGKGWQSISYIGIGRKSNPNNYNPIYKQAILVLNEEIYHQFHKTWQYSFAMSYRRQDEYDKNVPYDYVSPKLKQEFRLYSRLSYIFKTSRLKIVPTIRQEFRKFYSPNFTNVQENFQLRSRFRIQLSINLDNKKHHRLIASSEQLFSISKYNSTNNWNIFDYRESRFSLYYSYSPKTLPVILSVGYMNNLVGSKNKYDVNYFAFDIIFENLFKDKHRDKDNIKENLE